MTPQTAPEPRRAHARWGYTAVCVLLCCFCATLIFPVAETGLTDDWSTVRTAQLLAQTGHVYYNGWEAAILGWPLYVAAIFIKVSGHSFAAARASNLLEAAVTVALLHRLFLRCGLRSRNAVFGTVSVLLTPIFLLASVVFMTDIPGLLAVIVCLYSCIRALQAYSPSRAAAWVAFAAMANAMLGTARQIAWLGLLLMVPCTLWLLRRERLVLVAGVLSGAVSLCFIGACTWWFNHQPYVLVAPVVPGRFSLRVALAGSLAMIRSLLDSVLFLSPVLAISVPLLSRLDSERRKLFAGCALTLAAFWLGVMFTGHHNSWRAPFLLFDPVHPQTAENTFTMTQMPVKGPAPLLLGTNFQRILSLTTLFGVVTLLGTSLSIGSQPESASRECIGWRPLLLLTVPYLVAYSVFLASRGTYNYLYDRYLLLTVPFMALLLLRSYQRRTQQDVPWAASLLLLPMALYSVTTLHDTFAVYRAALRVANELQAAGYPRTAIDGGWEYNHYTQILSGRFVHQRGIRMPDGSVMPDRNTGASNECSLEVAAWTPDVHPLFAVSYPGGPCRPAEQFAPVHFRTWLPPFQRTAIAVHSVPIQ